MTVACLDIPCRVQFGGNRLRDAFESVFARDKSFSVEVREERLCLPCAVETCNRSRLYKECHQRVLREKNCATHTDSVDRRSLNKATAGWLVHFPEKLDSCKRNIRCSPEVGLSDQLKIWSSIHLQPTSNMSLASSKGIASISPTAL